MDSSDGKSAPIAPNRALFCGENDMMAQGGKTKRSNSSHPSKMLTRSRAQANKTPVFVDDQWNDTYIQAKDEQIEAMHAERADQGWDGLNDSDIDVDRSDDDDDPDADVWHSDSELSDEEAGDYLDDEADRKARALEGSNASPGLCANVFWTLLTLMGLSVLVYGLFRRRDAKWPLQSSSLAALVLKAVGNAVAVAAILSLAFWSICTERIPTTSTGFLWEKMELPDAQACQASLVSGWTVCLATATADWQQLPPACTHALLQGALSVISLAMLVNFYRVWLKSTLVLLLVSYLAFNAAAWLQAEQQAAVYIYSLDPTFAFVNESISIAIDGQNLVQGGVVAWVPYWGGLQQQKAYACDKLYAQSLHNGGVLVVFDQVNEYVPCYKPSADEPDAAFQCFEQFKLRVKDQKSVPGWSLNAELKTEEL